jgi:hypothetical protein
MRWFEQGAVLAVLVVATIFGAVIPWVVLWARESGAWERAVIAWQYMRARIWHD